MPQYLRRPDPPILIEANKYEDEKELPPGAFKGVDDKAYIKDIQDQDIEVSVGDWIVQEPDGIHHDTFSEEAFSQKYKLVGD